MDKHRNERLRVATLSPLAEDLRQSIVESEPRIEFLNGNDLLPPMRYAADYAGDPAFRRSAAQQAELDRALAHADAVFGVPGQSPRELKTAVSAAPRAVWWHTTAAGGGGQVAAAALRPADLARLTFTTSAGAHGTTLAEFTVFGLLAGAKTLPRLVHQQQQHLWSDRWTMGHLSEQRVLVAGLGGIGREVVRLLKAFGATVVGLSRHDDVPAGVDEVVHPRELSATVGTVDAIAITLPGTATTVDMFNAEVFAKVRPGVTLVNVGRGTVVDEAALIAALEDGRVGFAALDVAAVEPLPADSPLWAMPNVLISPHTAALTDREEGRVAQIFLDNARRLLDGRSLRNVVDTVEFY